MPLSTSKGTPECPGTFGLTFPAIIVGLGLRGFLAARVGFSPRVVAAEEAVVLFAPFTNFPIGGIKRALFVWPGTWVKKIWTREDLRMI